MPPCDARPAIYDTTTTTRSGDPSPVDTVGIASDLRWVDDGEKSKPSSSAETLSDEARMISIDEKNQIRHLVLSDRAAIAWFATLTAASFVLCCVVGYHIMAATRMSDLRHDMGRMRNPRPLLGGHYRRSDPILFRDAHPPRHIGDVGPAPALDVASCGVPFDLDHLDWDRYHRSHRTRDSNVGPGSREALVHPSMFAHPNPQRVGLVGMMDGNDVRLALVEVLRHKTVEEVTLIGCGPVEGEEASSDDAFVLLHDEEEGDRWSVADEEDALTWFADNVAALNNTTTDENGSRFDVIIMDLRSLWVSSWRDAVRLATDSLTPQGIFVVMLGESPSRDDPSLREGNRYYARVTDAIVNVNTFESFSVYEESRGELGRPISFLLACLDDCDYGWYSNEAEVNAMIHRRINSCLDDDDDDEFRTSSILNEFDGAMMGRYQRPPKAWESVYCRQDPTPSDCLHMKGFDPSIPNAPSSMFEVRTEDVSVGRGVFAIEMIPSGSYVMQEKGVQSVQFPPKTSDTLENLLDAQPEEAGELRAVTTYMYGYGFESWVMGDMGHFVDSSISTFTNHGCNGTYNTVAENIMPQISRGIMLSEDRADPMNMPWEEEEGDRFNPVMLRHLESYWTKNQRTFRRIERGEEVLENYLFFTQCEKEWVETVRELRAMCSGEEIGLVVLRDSSAGDV